jgi:hypothetical protein
LDEARKSDNVEQKIYESFCYERNSILNNVYDIIIFAAKQEEISTDTVFVGEAQIKRVAELKSKI